MRTIALDLFGGKQAVIERLFACICEAFAAAEERQKTFCLEVLGWNLDAKQASECSYHELKPFVNVFGLSDAAILGNMTMMTAEEELHWKRQQREFPSVLVGTLGYGDTKVLLDQSLNSYLLDRAIADLEWSDVPEPTKLMK